MRIWLLALPFLVVGTVPAAAGVLSDPEASLRVSGAPRAELGHAVGLHGEILVVGAPFSDEGGADRGAAYVFRASGTTWSFAAKLVPSDPADGDEFGTAVAVWGDTVTIGSPKDDDTASFSGSAYVYVEPAGGWSGTLTESAKLRASDPLLVATFGSTVAIEGSTLAIGAPHGPGTGAVYVFDEPAGGWSGSLTEDAKLTASDGFAQDFLGLSGLDLDGGTIVAGAHAGGFPDLGAAYVFEEPSGGWNGSVSESAKLVASDGADADRFGIAVSVSGGTVVVGADADDDDGPASGSAYVFVEPAGGWSGVLSEDAKLRASNGFDNRRFGRSVGVVGDLVAVGKRGAGEVHFFQTPPGGWSGVLVEDVMIPPVIPGHDFGRSLALHADRLAVGAPEDPFAGRDAGAAHVFGLTVASALSLTKVDSADPVLPGSRLDYTLTVRNDEIRQTADAVTLTDTLPAAMTLVAAVPGQGSCTPGFPVICDLGSVAAGASATVTLTVDTALAGLHTNSASVSATPPADPATAFTDETTVVSDPTIRIWKEPSLQEIAAGGSAHFVITVENDSLTVFDDVRVSDLLAPDCDAGLGSLAPGAATSYVCSLSMVTGGFTNSATVTATSAVGSGSDADTADVVIAAPGGAAILVSVEPPGQIVPSGGTADFTVSVQNTGSVGLTGVAIASPEIPDCERELGSLGAGAQASYACSAPGVLQGFAATLLARGALGGGEVTDAVGASVSVGAAGIDVRIDPASQAQATGESASFTITVDNTGEVELVSVRVDDTLAPDCDRDLGELAAGSSSVYACSSPPLPTPFTKVVVASGDTTSGISVSAVGIATVIAGFVVPALPALGAVGLGLALGAVGVRALRRRDEGLPPRRR